MGIREGGDSGSTVVLKENATKQAFNELAINVIQQLNKQHESGRKVEKVKMKHK